MDGMRIRAWNLTDVGRVRAHNEDACSAQVDGSRALGIVCDGMGGANAGEVASRVALETFSQVLQEMDGAPEEQLRLALERTNQAVYCYGWEHPECRGMGTTLVAALILGETAYILNVGDSRAYSIREKGIRQITRDHSLVEELLQAGQITPEQAKNHPRKNIITRALGTDRHVKGDLFLHRMLPGELLLLCSDGLSNELSEQELWDLTLHGGSSELGCRRLIDAALARGAHDNISAVLMEAQCPVER